MNDGMGIDAVSAGAIPQDQLHEEGARMGLLDDIVSTVSKNVGGQEQGGLLEQAIGMLNNPAMGGLGGLIDQFKNNGLGDIIASWVGTGENQAISADQITNALGADKISEIAGKLGIPDDEVSDRLAALLPQVIDKLTPEGVVPEGGILEQGLGLLSKKFLG